MKLRKLSVITAWGFLLGGMATAQTPVTFMGPSNFGSGTAVSMAMADFNGDGKLDMATAGSDVVVYLGDGRGSFQAQPAIGIAGTSIVAADFNGDGIPDLAVTSAFVAPSGFYVLLGNGDGSFGAPMFYSGDALYLVLGDFNGDGHVDIAGFGYQNGQVQIFFGEPGGTFEAGPVTTLPSATALAMVSSDFNGDGNADLALTLEITSSSAEVAVLFGNGDGTFASAVVYPEAGFLGGLVSADFNGDGTPDLAYLNSGFGTVDVLLNNGAGNFGAAVSTTVATLTLVTLAAADLNGDGIPDVLASSDGLGTELLGVGDGTFRLGEQFALAYYPVAAGIGDFNGDGVPDVASVNNPGTGTGLQPPFTVVLGAGKGKFRSARAFNPGYSPGRPALGDFNGDGKLDVAVANYGYSSPSTPSSIAVLLGDGDGDLGPARQYPAKQPTAIAISDVNHDGKLDLVFLENYKHLVTMLGNGDGTFGKAVTSACPGCGSYVLLVADVNHDGKPDVITSVFLGGSFGSLGILMGNGDGTFQAPVPYGFGGLSSVAAADFNNDGNLDLVATFTDMGAYVFLGNGNGTFGAPIPLDSQATDAITSVLNRDGNADIIVNTINSDGLGIYLGRGNGTFSPPISVNAQMVLAFPAADFSGNGLPDLVGAAVSNARTTGFSEILLGSGGAHFTLEKRQFPIGSTAISAGDFNGDGLLDLAAGGPNDTVWIILNTTNR